MQIYEAHMGVNQWLGKRRRRAREGGEGRGRGKGEREGRRSELTISQI
jgi:hypothetical protein